MFYTKVILGTVLTIALWVIFVGFGALNGWWNKAIAPAENTRLFMDAAVEIAESKNHGNVALVLMSNGEIFDEHYAGIEDEIDRETMFQTASMSKWITANCIMHLVQEGKLDLDRPIADYLTRWQLPQGEFDNDRVTVRLLLSHMAGLTDGLGFGDYGPEEAVPTLEESLSRPRGSKELEVEIEVGLEPGSEFRYSGGGYLLLQLLIEEVTGEGFEYYFQRTILEPLGMSRSTFGYIAERENISNAYDAEGRSAPLYRSAAKAATGFSTSAADMTRFVEFQVAGDASAHPLRRDTIDTMREPHASSMGADIWGLGTILYAPTGSGDYVYGHDGQNDPAINAAVRINPDTGDALIAFVSGGSSLATTLGYEWVLWQTGLPDVLHIGAAMRDAIPIFSVGGLLIPVLATAVVWRRRRAIAKEQPNKSSDK